MERFDKNGKIKTQIDNASIISFDIFDTLLLRPYVNPTDLFTHLEKLENAKGFSSQRKIAESNFLSARVQSQNQTEATFDDIYTMMDASFFKLKQAELNLEKQVLAANPEMKQIYHYALAAGKAIIIVSDMYLPIDFIESVLEKNGFGGYKKLYLSNDIGKRKDRGDMYDYVLADLGVPASEILHIGDNKQSDYERARQHGLKAIVYPAVVQRFLESNSRARDFYTKSSSLGASIITALNAWKSLAGTDDNYWTEFGYEYAAPAGYGYCRWIEKTAAANAVNDLLFVARDGFLLEKIFNTFNHGIKTQYIYAPRAFNYIANLDYDKDSNQQAKIVVDYYANNYESAAKLVKAADFTKTTYHEFIVQNRALFVELSALEKQQANYENYLQAKIDAKIAETANPVGVVDTISGQLSAQKLIKSISPLNIIGFYWVACGNRPVLSQLDYFDFFPRNSELAKIFLTDNRCDLIELMFTSPELPVKYIADGKPVYHDNPTEAEKIRQQIYPYILDGAMQFADDVKTIFGGADIFLSAQDLFNLIDGYVLSPGKRDKAEMMAIKKAPYADHNEYIPLFSAKIPLWRIRKIKQLIWRTPLQQFIACVFCPIKIKRRGIKLLEIYLFPILRRRYFTLSFSPTNDTGYSFIIGNKNG